MNQDKRMFRIDIILTYPVNHGNHDSGIVDKAQEVIGVNFE
ncbi:hypothetical protein MTBBW1_2100010 [Desulfamplus magnetovallimortis]|uniref:Uncharacterized protein n=1 Tax=Desulfamplus magnetovallimortis TaxID=1246637 RepID=A0A1W1HC46_9BACT|nr:hypothetical protein MTBBW1_2100010 [Desulfamplus magnetovallimortis]